MWNLEKSTESLCKDLLEDLKDKVNSILTLNYILITEIKLYVNNLVILSSMRSLMYCRVL